MSNPISVYYFGYGSNMQLATFRGRRGIRPLGAAAARVRGWRLVFDKPPIFPIGHSYANIVEDAAAELWGVVYEVTRADLEHIELTEGVPLGNYQRREIAVEVAGDEAQRQAFTLVSDRRAEGLKPSDRYLGIVIEGALEHGLPAEYVAYLRTVPCEPECEEAKRVRIKLDGLMRRPDGSAPES